MGRHHVTLSPDGRFIIVAVSGVRDGAAARVATTEVIAVRAKTGVDRILFDTRDGILLVKPDELVARAIECGRELAMSRIALLSETLDDTYARLWRKGLAETGHQAIVFTDVSAAEAWLLTEADAPMVYLP